MTTTYLTTLSPSEIDDLWFPLLAERWELTERIFAARKIVAKSIWTDEYVETYERYLGQWSPDRVHHLDVSKSWNHRQINEYNDRINELVAKRDEVKAAMAPFEVEWDRRGGWSRYVLVRAGHIHRQGCHTVRPTTAAVWDTRASGMNEDEVVTTYSYVACTKCFKDAPVTAKPSPESQGYCAGSGTYKVEDVNGSIRLYRPWGRCKECGQRASVTSTGKIRKHKAVS
jgi:hypothetical protein